MSTRRRISRSIRSRCGDVGLVPGGASEDPRQEGEDRIAGRQPDPEIPGRRRDQRAAGKPERRADAASGRGVQEQRAPEQQADRQAEVLRGGGPPGEGAGEAEPALVAVAPPAIEGDEGGGHEQREQRLDVGRAGVVDDDRVAEPERRRQRGERRRRRAARAPSRAAARRSRAWRRPTPPGRRGRRRARGRRRTATRPEAGTSAPAGCRRDRSRPTPPAGAPAAGGRWSRPRRPADRARGARVRGRRRPR